MEYTEHEGKPQNKTIDIYDKFNQVLFREKKKDVLEFLSSLINLILKGIILSGVYLLPTAINSSFNFNSTSGTITYLPGTSTSITSAVEGTNVTRTSVTSSTTTVPVDVTSYVNRLTAVRDTFSTAITNFQNTANTISNVINNYSTTITNFFGMFPGIPAIFNGLRDNMRLNELLAILQAILAGGRKKKSVEQGREILAGIGDDDQGRVELIQVNFETIYKKVIGHFPQGPPLDDKLEEMVANQEIQTDTDDTDLDSIDDLDLLEDKDFDATEGEEDGNKPLIALPQGPPSSDEELLPISMNLPDPNHWFFVAAKSPCKTAECVINSQPPREEEELKQKKIEACMKAAKNRKNVKGYICIIKQKKKPNLAAEGDEREQQMKQP